MLNPDIEDGEDQDGTRMSRAAESAYRQIRRAIITGELEAGATLQEAKLAERTGVSRTPVREALARLEGEGLVVLAKYRQGRVAQFTADDVAEIFRLRAVLEAQAAGRAALRITPEELDRLEAVEARMEEQFRQVGWREHLEAFDALNDEFHMIISRAARSPRLERILASSLELPAAIFNSYRETVERRMERSHWQHQEIIASLRARNAAWAEAQMAAHLLSLVANPE